MSGVYIASINNYLGSITGNSSVSMIEMDNQNAFKAYGSEGVNRTKLATSAVYLNSNHTYKNLLNSSASGPYPMEAGWSLYYINPMNRITGFAGPLGAPFTVSSSGTWTVVTGWNGTSSATRFSTVSPPYPDEYTATIAGLHFVSFLPVFGQIASPYDIKLGVYINQALSLYASMQHEVVDQLKSIPISGTVKLNIGDVVSFRIHSSIGNLQLTEETTRSLLFVEGLSHLLIQSLYSLRLIVHSSQETKKEPVDYLMRSITAIDFRDVVSYNYAPKHIQDRNKPKRSGKR